MIVFYISGEHEELAIEEINSIYEAHGKALSIIERCNRLVLAGDGPDPKLLRRLAFTHEIYHTFSVSKNPDEVLLGLGIKKDDSFCVRARGFQDNSTEEKRAGELIYESVNARVDLTNPDKPVYLLKINEVVAVCLEKYKSDDFESRDPNKRPFFHPLALSPKLARLFLNLARTKKGDSVLDPFCGSGSILIEAALMGLLPIGSDKDRKMLWGAKKNLEFYSLKSELHEGDATRIKEKNLDAIVSDPPYARASKMFDSGLEELYESFLASAFDALKPGGHLVIAVPKGARVAYEKHGFANIGDYELYVHRSLTRRVLVLRKP